MRALLAGFSLSLTLLLAACGDSDGPAMGGGRASPSTTVTSNVVKGVIRNGVVRAMRWSDGAYVEVASARTGDTGQFSLDIPQPVPGEVLRLELGLSADTSPARRTEMKCDVAQCGSATFGEWAPLTVSPGLSSWVRVGDDGTLTIMPMTPVSTLLVRYAESVGGGNIDGAALEAGLLRVASLFGMTPSALLARPGDIVDSAWLDLAADASPDAVKIALLSAAFAELSRTSGASIQDVIAAYVQAFVNNNGRLLQDGDAVSLGELYRGLNNVMALAGSPDVQAWATAWVGNVLAGLQSGRLNTSACAPDCAPFNSGALLDALGTGPHTLGADLRRVMAERNAATIEALLAGELARYGWLASGDTVAVAGVAVQVVAIAVMRSLGMPVSAPAGMQVVVDGDAVHLTGEQNGLAVDLRITVAQVLNTIQSHVYGTPGPVFTFGAVGVLENERVRANIDGTFVIDATGTDFRPLRDAFTALVMAQINGDSAGMLAAQKALIDSIAGILRTGAARFTLEGRAGIARVGGQGEEHVVASQLAVAGKAWLYVDMDGRTGGAISANGKVEHGTLTLPNGDHFSIDPGQGHYLTFALGRDGTASALFAANVLSHGAVVSGDGSIANLGALLTNLRDNIATQLQAMAFDFGALRNTLLADLGTLGLTVSGQAVIPDFGHTYTLTIADGRLRLSQPNSTAVALELSIGRQGMLARAGGKWWLVGIDLAGGAPALTLADSEGGDWRWEFDFSGLLAMY